MDRKNRFFTYEDFKQYNFVFDLNPDFFWSRLYEYPFALQFAKEGDVVLDVCCGTYHPLKFKLTEICKEVYACDLEFLSTNKIIDCVAEMFPNQTFDASVVYKIFIEQCNIVNMPYEDCKFDKAFCISSLEHMDVDTIRDGLKELKRVLKDDGTIILTIDYPKVIPKDFMVIVKDMGLEIDGNYNYEMPENAITSDYFEERYYCYNMILKKSK